MVKLELRSIAYRPPVLTRMRDYISAGRHWPCCRRLPSMPGRQIRDENDASQVNLYGHLLLRGHSFSTNACLAVSCPYTASKAVAVETNIEALQPSLDWLIYGISMKGTSGGSHQRSLETISEVFRYP